jgi:hypothetical protein
VIALYAPFFRLSRVILCIRSFIYDGWLVFCERYEWPVARIPARSNSLHNGSDRDESLRPREFCCCWIKKHGNNQNYPMSSGFVSSSDESLCCRWRDVHRRGASGGLVCEVGGGGDMDPHRHGLGDWEPCLLSTWKVIGVVVVVVVV